MPRRPARRPLLTAAALGTGLSVMPCGLGQTHNAGEEQRAFPFSGDELVVKGDSSKIALIPDEPLSDTVKVAREFGAKALTGKAGTE